MNRLKMYVGANVRSVLSSLRLPHIFISEGRTLVDIALPVSGDIRKRSSRKIFCRSTSPRGSRRVRLTI